MTYITFFKKIQPEQEQRTFTISFLKYCMKGGNPQRVFKLNIGYTAANGKSTEMDMHEAVFPIYTYELDNTFFSKTCTKRHKFGARLVECPIRLAYINELDDGKLDGKFFKKFGDCKNLPLEKMYDTMTDNSRIQSKLFRRKFPSTVPPDSPRCALKHFYHSCRDPTRLLLVCNSPMWYARF